MVQGFLRVLRRGKSYIYKSMFSRQLFQDLRIGYQTLCCLSKWALSGFTLLKSLRLDTCNIHPAPNIHPVAHTLNHLFMERNNLSYLPKTMLSGCKVLMTLNLSTNNFKSIPNITDVSDSLRYFYMHSNRVADVSALYEAPFPLLDTLHLSSNKITYFPYHPSGWPRLSYLDLSHNRIRSISSNFFWSAVSLIFTADYNPWHCGKDLCWIKHCNMSYTYRVYRCGGTGTWLLEDGEILCASPPTLKGQDALHAGIQHLEA